MSFEEEDDAILRAEARSSRSLGTCSMRDLR
jgi:hypothetical protein